MEKINECQHCGIEADDLEYCSVCFNNLVFQLQQKDEELRELLLVVRDLEDQLSHYTHD